MALTEAIEEYVEKLFWFSEAGIEPTQANLARAMQVSQPSVTEMARRLIDEGLVERDDRKRLQFTPEGEKVAKHIVSRHRLIEAYLVSEFGIPWDEVHEEAHTFEHAISPRLEQLMYEKLPHVTACPHGHPIGDNRRETGEILAAVPVGSKVVVLRLENEDPDLLRLLKRTGIEPGDTIELLGLEGESLSLDTRLGHTELPLDAAQSVSVSVSDRGEGPHGVVADLDPAALLTAGVWGR